MTDVFRTSKAVSALDPGKPHIVLVGLPGAGKSTAGALLADRLGKTFLDFDVEIERREGMPITQIFGERGEQAFRMLERKVTEELRDFGNMVVAPGSGWILDPEVVAMIRPPAKLVYLRVRPETALKRLGAAGGGRPVLSRPDPLAELQAMFEVRRSLYQGAEIEIGAELLTPQEVVDQIAAKLGVP